MAGSTRVESYGRPTSPSDEPKNTTTQKRPDICVTLVHGTWPRGFLASLRHSDRAIIGVSSGAAFGGALALLLFNSAETTVKFAVAGGLLAVAVVYLMSRVRRNALWFEDGSSFRTRLSSKLNDRGVRCIFLVCEWSGANSIIERAKAAKDFAAFLCASSKEHPDAKQIVIAHSHGGNVVRLALEHLPTPERILVVTMGTPFMEIGMSYVYRRLKKRAMGALSLSFAGLLAMRYPLEDMTMSLLVLSANIAFYLGISLGNRLIFRLTKTTTKRLITITERAMDWPSSVQLIVIRAIDDEASLALTAATIANRILLALVIILPTLCLISLMVLLLLLVLSANINLPYVVVLSILEPSAFMTIATWLLALPGGAVLLGGLTACACKSVYGRELFLGALMSEVNSDSIPDNLGSSVAAQTLTGPPFFQSGRRHSIYDHAMCAFWISAYIDWWLQNRL